MITIRYWLQQLFKCVFIRACFYNIVFNPEMINILFDNDKTISLQFNIQEVKLYAVKKTIENIFKFYLNHISNSGYLYINLNNVDIKDHHKNILFNIIINKGNKTLEIIVEGYKLAKLHDLVIEYIITSKDCSNMVPKIILLCSDYPNFKLNERAENVEIDDSTYTYKISTKYQISNIYNPKVRFEFCNEEDRVGWNYWNKVEIMKNNCF
uniref:Uncharacterized protein n=1 Tax=Meloidogyne enterolobii TaxID=390850 RepID=A0A6V7WVH6_MELEN|nr:unnamed protein product [Meloidogyne enterolobii]